ncbi:hypothetical protein HPP92_005650 [Vanilla planifolia]|uniref:Uncharacterized protein n=1 Tax=Vanilla planifolia TaxID=51239 RepID=A0A835RUF4_VANPL|nr:hypothetical protein HPP92_005650 [Vanilla planifolia]
MRWDRQRPTESRKTAAVAFPSPNGRVGNSCLSTQNHHSPSRSRCQGKRSL